jgi:hypothetical protein
VLRATLIAAASLTWLPACITPQPDAKPSPATTSTRQPAQEARVTNNNNNSGSNAPPPGSTFNVNSTNQQGGITAGIVNQYGPQPRDLPQGVQQALAAIVNKYPKGKIKIQYTNDAECERLARMIGFAFSAVGWERDYGAHIDIGLPTGIVVEEHTDNPMLTEIATLLVQSGFKVVLKKGAPEDQIYIGQNL